MKKTYMKPSMEVYEITSAQPIALSKNSVEADVESEVLSNERKGIFSSEGDGYKRTLW